MQVFLYVIYIYLLNIYIFIIYIYKQTMSQMCNWYNSYKNLCNILLDTSFLNCNTLECNLCFSIHYFFLLHYGLHTQYVLITFKRIWWFYVNVFFSSISDVNVLQRITEAVNLGDCWQNDGLPKEYKVSSFLQGDKL